MKYIKKYNEGIFQKSEIEKIIKELGLSIRENNRTYPKNGFEFNIEEIDGSFLVETSYYGTIFKKEKTDNLKEYLSNMLKTKPDIVHKYNYHYKK